MFFGYKLPPNIVACELYRKVNEDMMHVRWRVRGDPEVHEMPFHQTDESVKAVVTAIKLTC